MTPFYFAVVFEITKQHEANFKFAAPYGDLSNIYNWSVIFFKNFFRIYFLNFFWYLYSF